LSTIVHNIRRERGDMFPNSRLRQFFNYPLFGNLSRIEGGISPQLGAVIRF
jgi:hypothetical protein